MPHRWLKNCGSCQDKHDWKQLPGLFMSIDVKVQIDTCRIKRNTRSRWAALHALVDATGLVCTNAFDLSVSATLDTLDTADWVRWKMTGKPP